ncbi:uncharacterized protein LOC117918708 isoform X1 [Vitis riparia]|uniref:uncharacterized protein LOC117918708 isoform X1 n=1 Tax=Vitis riparia TaxID=96939 RepID=UPI00155AA2A2|nr:uncharacterized protein LOC117918708 isoform X1 [Vitis riparia]
MERRSTESDSVRLLGLSQDLLRYRNFSSSRRYALQALLSHPNLRWPHQILAILHVLIAADHPINPHLPDWYSILQLHPLSDNTPLIRKQFDKLSLLLNPLTNHFPFSQDAFTLVRDAWSLLSRPDRKALYDRRLAQHSSKMEDNGDTFWTLCPYCYCLFQYYRVYEDCCLRCQNCTRAFQAVMIPSPPKAVEGTNHYCCFGFFPLGFSGNVDEPKNDFVDISDKSEDSSGELGRKKKGNTINLDSEKPKEEEVEKGGDRTVENIKTGDVDGEFGVTGKRRVMNVERAKPEEEEARKGSDGIGEKVKTSEDGFLSPNVTKRPMKRKSVAKNTKKLMGTGKRGRRYQNIIFAMGTDKPNCNVKAGSGVEEGGAGMVGGLGSGSSGVCVFAGRELCEEDDDIPVGVPISCDGWNGNFKSF